MKIEEGDIVVADVAKTAKFSTRNILKVTKVDDVRFDGVSLLKGARIPMTLETKVVLANLGKEPKDGWVYGLVISGGYEGTTEVNGMDVILKVKPPEGMMDDVAKCLEKFKAVFGLLTFQMEIHGPHGKRMGFWRTYKRGGTDTMGIHLAAFYAGEIEDTMVHESGHGIWNRLVDENFRARFIEAYTRSIDVAPVSMIRIKNMAHAFDTHNGTVRTFKKALLKADAKVFGQMIRWIKETHHITREDIDKLREGKFRVASYFPSHEMVTSVVNPVITQYATTKPVEFFCEAWAHYWVDKQMPEAVVDICDELCVKLGIEPR